MLKEKILYRQSGITLYGITPPKISTSSEKLAEISATQIQRINSLNIDGLIIYDLQDELARTTENRPFPFTETVDSFLYSENYLKSLTVPKIIYRAVAKYNALELTGLIENASSEQYLSVFVGAASKLQNVNLTIRDAYNLDAAKSFLSDYYYHGKEHNIPLVPIIFTLTPRGSLRTLQFMRWLGISIPKWLENELINSNDILTKSIELSKNIWLELKDFADAKDIPVGRNIESVSMRKEEIDASIELLKRTG